MENIYRQCTGQIIDYDNESYLEFECQSGNVRRFRLSAVFQKDLGKYMHQKVKLKLVKAEISNWSGTGIFWLVVNVKKVK